MNIADGRTIQSSFHVWSYRNGDECRQEQTKTLLQDVYVIPGLRKTLLSISQPAKKGIHTSFTEQVASLWKLDDMGFKSVVGCAAWDNGLRYLNGHAIASAVDSITENLMSV